MIPDGWKVTKLSNICDFINGRAFKSNEWGKEGLPIIRIQNLNGAKDFNYTKASYEDQIHIKQGEMLFSWSGSFGPYIWDGPAGLLNQHIFKVTIKEEHIDFFFFYYSLVSITKLVGSRAHGGAGLMHIKKSDLVKYTILLPTLEEQKRIAEILSGVDASIEKTKVVIAQTKKVKQGLLQELLMRGIGHTKFKKSPLGKIPDGWQVLSLSKLTVSKGEYGANVPAIDYSHNLPRYVRITDIDEDGNLLPHTRKSIAMQDVAAYLLKEEDFLFARSGATVGKTYRHKKENGLCAFAGYLIKFQINVDRLLPAYLDCYTRSTYYQNWIKHTIRAGAQPNINEKEYGSMLIAVPTIKEQLLTCKYINAVDNSMLHEQNKLASLQTLKKGLMQDLLIGKVRTTHLQQMHAS